MEISTTADPADPADPTDPLAEATTARVIQLANEGRKYGIWLLLCSQRPSRIHESVLAQCDNLALMRMSSPGDLSQLERVFGFAPPEMLVPHQGSGRESA